MLISKSAARITKFTRGPSVASYLHEKQASRIQSLIKVEVFYSLLFERKKETFYKIIYLKVSHTHTVIFHAEAFKN